jgi:hypothetical protein
MRVPNFDRREEIEWGSLPQVPGTGVEIAG